MGSASPSFTAADLVRSVNKRIRQTYLKKRLLTTYKALERMTQMGFDLEKLKDVVNEGELSSHPELVNLLSSTAITSQPHKKEAIASAVVGAENISQLGVSASGLKTLKSGKNCAIKASEPASAAASASASAAASKVDQSLSCKDIERDRGKPLSKYDRNVMIFDWLHTLDETATIDLS